jgi:S1-C subfamily serine protease
VVEVAAATVPLEDSETLKVGEYVVAYPFGLGQTVMFRIVSLPGRTAGLHQN